MLHIDELNLLVKIYRSALEQIRNDSIPNTKQWRIANNALRRNLPRKPKQLELFEQALE